MCHSFLFLLFILFIFQGSIFNSSQSHADISSMLVYSFGITDALCFALWIWDLYITWVLLAVLFFIAPPNDILKDSFMFIMVLSPACVLMACQSKDIKQLLAICYCVEIKLKGPVFITAFLLSLFLFFLVCLFSIIYNIGHSDSFPV